MKRFFLFLAALVLGSAALAQTSSYRPLTTSPFKTVLYVSQEVTVARESTTRARVAPLLVATGGLAANRFVTDVPGYKLAASLPVMELGNPSDQMAALAVAESWMQLNAVQFVGRMGDYLRREGISNGFFSFTQEFLLRTALGPKRKLMAWTLNVDASSRPVYGSPKIIDADPIFVEAQYLPATAADGLPQHWASSPEAGKLKWRLMNKRWEEIQGWQVLEANGAYDQDTSGSEKLACLMDLRHAGCTGPVDIRYLLDATGATAAFVNYSRQAQPLYDCNAQTGDCVARGAISYDARVVSCGSLKNTGFYGLALQLQGERYIATPSTALVQYQPVGQFRATAVSPTEAFSKEIPDSQLAGRNPDRFVLSPYPGDNSLLDRESAAVSAMVVYAAPLRSDVAGSGIIDNVTTAPDMPLAEVASVGPVKEYYIGTVGDNYWRTGVYDREVQFNTSNPQSTQEFAMVAEGFEDWMMVSLNGHPIFVGPYPGSDMLELSSGAGFAEVPAAAACSTSADGRAVCNSGALLERAAVSCQEGINCTCPAGFGMSGWGAQGVCERRTPVAYNTCFASTVANGDSGQTRVQGYTCGNGCPAGLVQYKSGARAGVVSMEALLGYDGCRRPELNYSFLLNNYYDLRPYLVAGRNSLRIRVIVGGLGEGWIRVRTQACANTQLAPTGAPPAVPAHGGQGGVANATAGIANQARPPTSN